MLQIDWHLMFRVGDSDGLARCVAQAGDRLGREHTVSGGKRYWKIPELWECRLVTRVEDAPVAEQTLEVLLQAFSLAYGWNIHGEVSAESTVGLTGVFAAPGDKAKVPGLEWGAFEVAEAAPDGTRAGGGLA